MHEKYFLKGTKIRSSILLMILFINVCSIMALTCFNYYVFHRMSGKAYLEGFISYNQRVTELAFHNIDKQIMQSVLHLPELYFSPIKENDPLLLPQEERIVGSTKKIQGFTAQMHKIQKVYPYIKSIDIYYEATGTIVTGFDRVHFPQEDDLINQYLPWYKENQKNVEQEFIMEAEGVYSIAGPVITYIRRISQPKWGEEDILLAVHLDPDSFGEYIDSKAGYLGILAWDGKKLYDSVPLEAVVYTVEAVAEHAKMQKVNLKEENTPFSFKENGETVTVFHMISPTTGLQYFYRIDNSRFYQDYNVTNRMFIWNFLASIGFNIIVLALISYYNYTTYRKRIWTLSQHAGIAIGESNQSFDGSLQVLTGEISTLHAAINSSKGLLFQSAVRSMILSRKAENVYTELDPYLTGDSICTCFLYLSERDVEKISVESIQEKYPPRSIGCNVLFTTIDKEGLVAVLIFNENSKEQIWTEFVGQMDEYWENYSMVVGQMFPISKDGVKKSYKTTVETARYKFIFTKNKILTYKEIEVDKRKGSGSHLKLFDMMERDINSEHFLDFKTNLERLLTSFGSGNYTIEYCNSTLRDLVTLLYQVMQHNQLDMWVVFGYDIREYYRQIPDINVFGEWCSGLCETILKSIRQKKTSVNTDVQSKVIQLIEDNLEKNISLDFLAEQLQVRPDVASRMFRQMMGKNYTEYIKTRKLERAIELMKENYTMNEIAEILGYSSAQYFIKVFKENYGTTPYQYKKNLKTER